ncbi:MAG: Rieske (2Fe-2S) protein [Gemmatimonadaceae bacterium]
MAHDTDAGCAEGCADGRLANFASGAASTEIGRRTFLVQSGLLAAAAALSACAISGDVTSPTFSGSTTFDVNSNSSLSAVGGVALVTAGGAQLAIVRTDTASFVALSRVCPHQGGIVNRSGSGFQCPVHGATFNSTGVWIGGQRTSSLHAYSTSYDATTGILTIS